jgi:organic radical activating enzyme
MLLEVIKNTNKEILIYGASVYGELAYRGLEVLNVKPICFVDRAFQGGSLYMNTPVIKPQQLVNRRDAIILIASADFYYEILTFLEGMDCENIFDISELLKLEVPENKLSPRALEMYHARENYFSAVSGTKLTIVHLGLCVTEKCSLKCKDCSFLMPYYQSPQNFDLDLYKTGIDRLLDTVDFIAELRLYGGEPFLNPDLYKIIKWYKYSEKIETISIYTNGTIIPDNQTLSSMETRKVKVHISDYKHNKSKFGRLCEALEPKNISYFIRKYSEWQEAGNLENRSYTDDQCEKIYNSCFATNCYSFVKGKFYVCPRAAHAANLGAIPDNPDDCIDFMDQNYTFDELREKLEYLMYSKRFIHACRYCNGLNNHIKGIEPAIQTKGLLTYRKTV